MIVVMSENHSIRQGGEQVSIRMTACEAVERYVVGGRGTVVLASSEPTGLRYVETITTYFDAMQDTCGGLSGSIPDSIKCIEEYLIPEVGLIIVIVANKIALTLVEVLSRQISRPTTKIHISGMPDVYVLE